ncbi:MAG TPA: hypothetical protein VJ953_21460 [Saprospiraceae bacterium]|nr:hypothetical protein [Saprospiraceae bacterium]
MFTINIYLRFALIALGIIGGTILSAVWGFWYGFPFILIGLVLLAGYIALGTIQSSAELMQTGDLEKTEQRLDLTLMPKWLYVSQRAYYYMLKGSIALSRKKMDEGEEWLRKAQSVKVPTDNEKGMIEIQLASIHANKGKRKQAQMHLRNAKQLNITEATIKDQLKQLEQGLKNMGAMNAANRMGGRGQVGIKGGKSKRRRPRMK